METWTTTCGLITVAVNSWWMYRWLAIRIRILYKVELSLSQAFASYYLVYIRPTGLKM